MNLEVELQNLNSLCLVNFLIGKATDKKIT